MANAPQRKIIHVDMDAFYASVEQRDRPELKGKPVVVGGTPGGRGVVASASYEARRYGIRSAMPAGKALQLCPHTIFVRPSFSKYKAVSSQIRDIFSEATDLIEFLSLDEAYLDVTENKLGEPYATRIAEHLRARIASELGLTASAGVAPNKFLAKLASDLKKPNGLVVISPDKVEAFLRRLPVEKLWGVGPATAKKLHELGLFTTEEIRRMTPALLEQRFGKFGLFLHRLAHGEDNRQVSPHREPKSRGSETTFEKDILSLPQIRDVLKELSDDVAQGLARNELKGRTVTLKLRYSDFTTVTRSHSRPIAFSELGTIYELAEGLLQKTEAGRRPVRLVGVTVSHFIDENDPQQLSFCLE